MNRKRGLVCRSMTPSKRERSVRATMTLNPPPPPHPRHDMCTLCAGYHPKWPTSIILLIHKRLRFLSTIYTTYSQPHNTEWGRFPLFSFKNFDHFFLFSKFLPHFGLPGEWVAHSRRPWLYCLILHPTRTECWWENPWI